VKETQRLAGLIAATYTPLDSVGTFDAAQVAPLVEYLIDAGVSGLYVCGSTGEGMSLSSDERKAVLETFVDANDGRVPVIAQVGHNSLAEARQHTLSSTGLMRFRQPVRPISRCLMSRRWSHAWPSLRPALPNCRSTITTFRH
jgi:hypothetical protein